MFTTVEEVKQLTGYDVDNAKITMAQSIIEAYVGKVEVEVSDANDLALLGKATAYQVAYMGLQMPLVFEQMQTTSIMQFGQQISFSASSDAPFLAPLAVISCRHLSWKRLRSVKTGSIFSSTPDTDTEWSKD